MTEQQINCLDNLPDDLLRSQDCSCCGCGIEAAGRRWGCEGLLLRKFCTSGL